MTTSVSISSITKTVDEIHSAKPDWLIVVLGENVTTTGKRVLSFNSFGRHLLRGLEPDVIIIPAQYLNRETYQLICEYLGRSPRGKGELVICFSDSSLPPHGITGLLDDVSRTASELANTLRKEGLR